MLNDLYFKTTCNIRAHFLGPMGGLKIEEPLYIILGTNESSAQFKSLSVYFSCAHNEMNDFQDVT